VSEGYSLEVSQLAALNIDALREIWRGRYGAPPAIRSGDFMRRLLAEKLQMEGAERDTDLERQLAKLARTYERGGAVTPAKPGFRAGSTLVREYGDQTYIVEVLANGFRWNGRDWKSLSQIAREITGVRWNGPRFFGLRESQ